MALNPYTRLAARFSEFATKVVSPKTKLWDRFFPKASLEHADLRWVAEYVRAGRILGYDSVVTVDDNGDLNFNYVEKRPRRPFGI